MLREIIKGGVQKVKRGTQWAIGRRPEEKNYGKKVLNAVVASRRRHGVLSQNGVNRISRVELVRSGLTANVITPRVYNLQFRANNYEVASPFFPDFIRYRITQLLDRHRNHIHHRSDWVDLGSDKVASIARMPSRYLKVRVSPTTGLIILESRSRNSIAYSARPMALSGARVYTWNKEKGNKTGKTSNSNRNAFNETNAIVQMALASGRRR